jgi:hypothetical protein
LVEGQIQDINYTPIYDSQSLSQINSSSGGILAKSVPKPKNLSEESDKVFIASLNSRELELNQIYE